MPTRRAFLLGGGVAAGTVAAGAAVGVHQGVLPGRPWVQATLGLNGEAGVIPRDVEPVLGITDTFRSAHRGQRVEWTTWAPYSETALPVVVALHGLRQNDLGDSLGIGSYLGQALKSGVPPFGIVAPDGGTSYWHPHGGEDAGAMVTDELLPLLARRGFEVSRIGLLGWSMGGYGALRLGGILGPDRVAAIAAVSPALWNDPAEASPSGFDSVEEYEQFSVIGRQRDLAGIPVRVDCGTGDPFYRAAEDYVAGFPDDAEVVSTFEPGAHDGDYWRRMLPAQLEFLGRRVGSTA